MVQFTLPRNSKVVEGQTWSLKHKAPGNKGTRDYRVYRFDPDSGTRSCGRRGPAPWCHR